MSSKIVVVVFLHVTSLFENMKNHFTIAVVNMVIFVKCPFRHTPPGGGIEPATNIASGFYSFNEENCDFY